jgi:outer membrane cobalamin receptor
MIRSTRFKMRRTVFLMLGLCLSVVPRGVGAQTVPELSPLVITASRYAQRSNTVPAHVIIVSSAEIMAAPAHALDDVLRSVPGAQIGLLGSSNIINPALQTVSLLGVGMPILGGVRSLVMMDGLPLTDGFGGWVPWSMVPNDIVERVEVMLGASSSLYGSSAMGGAINVITRSPKERAADLNVSYGSRNTKKLNVYASDAFLNKFGLSIDYNDYRTDGYKWLQPNVRGPVDQNSTARNQALNVKAASLASDDGGPLWFVHGIAFHDERNHGLPHWFDSRDVLTAAAGAHRGLEDGGEVRGQAFLGEYNLDSTNSQANAARTSDAIAIHNFMPSFDSGASLQWSRPFETLSSSVTVGVDIRHTAARNNEDDYSTPGAYSNSISSGGQQTTVGVFGQWALSPVTDLIVVPSARVDYWQNHGAFQIDSAGKAPIPAKKFAFFSPRLAARYQLLESLAVRGAVYRAFFAPNLQALYRGANAQGQLDLPNSELSPEILRVGGEFGSDLTLGSLAVRATLFWNEIKDAIVTTTVSATPLVTKPENIGGIRSRGVVVEAPWRVTRRWSLSPAYTYTDAVVTSNSVNPGLVGNMLALVPRHQASLKLGFDDPRIATACLAGRYVSRRWGNDTNTQNLDEHFVMDLAVSRWLTKSLEVYFDGENLLDRRYTIAQMGLPVLGEPLYVALGLRLHYR